MSRYVVALVGLVTIAGGLLLSRPLAPPALAGVGGTGNFLRKQINIYNRGDLDGEVATFAEAAVLVGPGSCTPASPCVGKDAIRAALAASIVDRGSCPGHYRHLRGGGQHGHRPAGVALRPDPGRGQ